MIKVPYAEGNRAWLQGENLRRPDWDAKYKCWLTPVAWFEDVIRRALERFGAVYVIQQYRTLEKCAPACWRARGMHCECSCMGVNHGRDVREGKWYEISDTCAVQWGERQLACRLIEPVGSVEAETQLE